MFVRWVFRRRVSDDRPQKPVAHVPTGGGEGAEEPFDRATVLADRLLHEGTHTVYEMRRSDLM